MQRGYIVRDRRRYIAVSLLSCVFSLSAVTATVDAGSMFGWLHQNNQSQALAATTPVPNPYATNNVAATTAGYAAPGYTTAGYAAPGYAAPGYAAPGYTTAGYAPTNYANPSYANPNYANPSYARAGYGYTGYAAPRTTVGYAPPATTTAAAIPVPPPPASVRGQSSKRCCFSGCCLFGSKKQPTYAATQPPPTAAPALAAAATAPPTTACHSGSCGPGWCQQTVVRYVPQIAYRTAYQPVPVTTYRTTTTINPQNGLPRTCTRPCTSYSYQARRVPYTTYRPVYTTVPVSDTVGGAPATPAGYNAGYAGAQAGGNCASCQTGAATGWQNAATGAPGYTPGNAAALPAGPTAPGATGGPSATPWRRVEPGAATTGQPPAAQGYGAPAAPAAAPQGYGANPPGATPWGPASNASPWGPASGAAPPTSGQEADRRPALRPEYDDAAYGQYDQTNGAAAPAYQEPQQNAQNYLKPVPMPESLRRRATPSNTRIDGGNDAAVYGPSQPTVTDNRRPSQKTTDGSYGSTGFPGSGDMFTTPNRSVPADYDRPRSNVAPPPLDKLELWETRKQHDRRAVPDLERARRVRDSAPVYPDDNTARRDVVEPSRGVRPLHEDETQPSTRYAAVPIDWSREHRQTSHASSVSTGHSTESDSQQNGWRPIR